MTILLESDPVTAGTLAAGLGDPQVVDTVITLRRALTDAVHDLVVVGPGVDLQSALEVAAAERVTRPALGVVLVRRRVDSAVLREAIRAGVREVVKADDTAQLAEACASSLALSQQVRGLAEGAAAGDRPQGQLITVFSAKGGCGKTTVATNTAVALGASGRRVCLVDLDLAFGDVAIALQLYPSHTIGELAGLDSAIDESAVRALLTPHSSGIDTLVSPLSPGTADEVSAEAVTGLLRVLKRMYEVVVVDSPPAFTDQVLAAFDESDHFVLLATLDIPALKNLKLAMEAMETLAYPRERYHVVLNRSDAKVGLAVADVEKTLRTRIEARIPSSRAVPSSVNRGVPIVLDQPNHPVSTAIRSLALTLVPPAQAPTAARRVLGFRRPALSAQGLPARAQA